MRFPALSNIGLLLALGSFGCRAGSPSLVVSSKMHTESYVTAAMASLLLGQSGFRVREMFGIGSTINRVGLLTEQIDLYPEYTGTAWTVYLGRKDPPGNAEDLFAAVARADSRNSITWLEQTRVNNTYALAIRERDRARLGASLSSLVRYSNDHPGLLRFAISHEFHERPDGFRAMAARYGLALSSGQVRTMDIGLSFEAIARGQVDVAMVFSTDGKLLKHRLLVLSDDRAFFPVYRLCFVVRSAVLRRHPQIARVLQPLGRVLTNAAVQRLNYEVDAEGLPPEFVADRFLRARALLHR